MRPVKPSCPSTMWLIVEGEWGWIEDIHTTYVVVKIWDERRLIVPTTYFLEP